jgi:hypothetical protein
VRRDENIGRFVVAVTEGVDDSVHGYVLDEQLRLGSRFTAWAVGDSVAMPAPWLMLAGSGICTVLGILGWRWRRGVAGGAQDVKAEAVFWRYCVLVLGVAGAPIVIAFLGGVGR